MATSWGTVLTDLIPLALVITLSPLSIIPAVMVLQSERARPASLMYLLGWVLALAALTAIFVEISGLIGGLEQPPKWASWLRIVLGAALIVLGVIRWLRRHRSAHSPAWMRQLSNTPPGKAGALAALLAVVNPKVLFICIAAGLAIGSAGLGTTRAWLAVIYFVAVAASSVAIPVLAYALSGDRLKEPLARLKNWMEKQHAALIAAIFVAIGLLLLYHGFDALLKEAAR